MNTPRRSKIARLPRPIREQLNTRLQNGEEGATLVEWLNSMPEVQAILALHFDRNPIREQNLSDWRNGAYREWLVQQDAIAAVQHLNNDVISLRAISGELSDNVALWLTARYLVAAQKMIDTDGALDWKMLRELCSDLASLRRGDHSQARIILDGRRQVVEERYITDRWKRSIILGLDSLKVFVDENPKAKKVYDELLKLALDPFDHLMEEPLAAPDPLFDPPVHQSFMDRLMKPEAAAVPPKPIARKTSPNPVGSSVTPPAPESIPTPSQ
jgi:hypothetical protein